MEQKKKALGRGLEELFSTEVLDFDTFESNIMENATTNEIQDIPINEIRPNPYQPRKSFNEEALRELSESIKNHGVFQPIIVKKGIRGYDLIAGERRLRASKMAGLDKIPAIVKDFSDDEMREIALLENIQRENLTAIELAWAYKGIIDNLDIRQEDLALRIGKSRSHITNTLGLLNLPEEVQKMILNGELSMGHARVLSKMEDESKITGLAKKIINEGLSVHEIEEISKDEEIKKRVPITRRERNTDYTNIENELKDILGTKVKVDNKKIILGNRKIIEKFSVENNHLDDEKMLTSNGNSIIYVASEKEVLALIGVNDIVRKNAKNVISQLKNHNIKTIMLTGDNKETAEKIGQELGISEVISNVLPSQKSETIKTLKQDGNRVMMCGDGINDSPALTCADIGVSVKSGTDIAMDSSDVILTKNDLDSILKLIKISEKTIRNIKQNLFWAFFYNCLMIPIAIGLLKPFGISINPMIASLAMVFSSFTVILNALRLKK